MQSVPEYVYSEDVELSPNCRVRFVDFRVLESCQASLLLRFKSADIPDLQYDAESRCYYTTSNSTIKSVGYGVVIQGDDGQYVKVDRLALLPSDILSIIAELKTA